MRHNNAYSILNTHSSISFKNNKIPPSVYRGRIKIGDAGALYNKMLIGKPFESDPDNLVRLQRFYDAHQLKLRRVRQQYKRLIEREKSLQTLKVKPRHQDAFRRETEALAHKINSRKEKMQDLYHQIGVVSIDARSLSGDLQGKLGIDRQYIFHDRLGKGERFNP